MTAKQYARLRQALYLLGSLILKTLGVYGIIEDDKGQILTLVLSALLDLAFFKVDVPNENLGDEGETA